jgi:tetratricopeptide (TPR) repeat protein
MNEMERRNLAAMHKLGYTHIRNNEITQAITIFTEILRGQKERHGKHSLQAAMAMHNLGVVYVKSNQYYETSKLCEMASKIRREELGKDHLDVAVSLAQMGVALMELSKYEDALVVFQEALRIRRLNFGHDCNHTLIVRILNNIGCALFEMDKMEEARVAFEETLCMQRQLMKEDTTANTNKSEKDNGGGKEKKVNLAKGRSCGSSGELSSSGGGTTDQKKGSNQMLLSVALTLCNLGSIHLRTGKLDASFVVFKEALLVSDL